MLDDLPDHLPRGLGLRLWIRDGLVEHREDAKRKRVAYGAQAVVNAGSNRVGCAQCGVRSTTRDNAVIACKMRQEAALFVVTYRRAAPGEHQTLLWPGIGLARCA